MNYSVAMNLYILVLCSVLLGQAVGNSNHHAGNAIELNAYNFDVTGRDFQNTQTEKLCLLARLNASISLSYK